MYIHVGRLLESGECSFQSKLLLPIILIAFIGSCINISSLIEVNSPFFFLTSSNTLIEQEGNEENRGRTKITLDTRGRRMFHR